MYSLLSRPLLAIAFAAMSAAGPAAQAAEPHVHGQATLDVAVEGHVLSIALASPLDNVFGFERLPRTDAERQKVHQAIAGLRDGAALFLPSPEADCRFEAAQVHFGALHHGLTGEGDAPRGKPQAEHQHADLDADYRFRCARPEALRAIEVRVFRLFPGANRIAAQLAADKRQSGATLTPAQSRLRW
ncbi:DUF2796 domain-containing protein [Cupriavidus gilardii]|uniref:DUF2796 domain-containing protein n=1 Tax=Cupriavidus gilardii TaxID=82541 RepID=UPI001ABDFBC7|nr:DUF2796 domain-containing protein [Cupriavidus gilardii]MBO4122615.1 DUF2796 domain-containing protein [Cupriavidus gilardii]